MKALVVLLITIAVITTATWLLGRRARSALASRDVRDIVGTDSAVRKLGRALFLRSPRLRGDEVVLLARASNWWKDGLSVGGCVYILDSGRVQWRSSRLGLPICEWSINLPDVRTVRFIEPSEDQPRSAAGFRRKCELVLNDDTTRIIIPHQIGDVLLRAQSLAAVVGLRDALIQAVGVGSNVT